MKLITIPIVEFALPSPRTGSIEVHSGYGRPAAQGREIHQRIQKKRADADPSYQAEVQVSGRFERGGYLFRVEGRIDGIYRQNPPIIEEIKSCFNVGELKHRLAVNPFDHPYCLQLLTYGYLYRCEYQILPALTFHLVSSRNGRGEDLPLDFDILRYEQWLERRLDELVSEAKFAEKHADRRRKMAPGFFFPFAKPRPGQIELMAEVERGLAEGRPMLFQAPTGLGKTIGVLYPVLKEALQQGQKVLYVTPKNSQHPVAEDAVARFREAGSPVRSLTITAKSKICFLGEPRCSPDYCEYARDYYAKVQAGGIRELLSKKKKLKARIFRDIGMEFRVCPFELQLECADASDVVICDYNYVFAPKSSGGRMSSIGIGQPGKPNLVIDEAHNLPARAMDYYSPTISSAVLEKMREEMVNTPAPFRREAEALLDGCLRVVSSCGRASGSAKPARIVPPTDHFLEHDARLRVFLSRYLDTQAEMEPQDILLKLCHYWSEFTQALAAADNPDRPEFFVTYHPQPPGGKVKITCCDASAMLEDCYDDYGQVVAFSATLKPFDYYAGLSGLPVERVKTGEFLSPFPKELRKILIIPQVSTKYSHRERNYARIADAVHRIAAVRQGNYCVFLPSFEFLEKVAALFLPPAGFTVLKQERDMKNAGIEAILEHLRDGRMPTIFFAVQGGSFSEGIDYSGEMLIGAFVVGPPLPTYDLERELMKEYYQKRYGAGFEYACTIPAMAKAVQAAGRVIRSETDCGLIVLMDGRFTEPLYSSAMPADWFETDATELVSGAILKEVADFWEIQGSSFA